MDNRHLEGLKSFYNELIIEQSNLLNKSKNSFENDIEQKKNEKLLFMINNLLNTTLKYMNFVKKE